MKFLARYSLLFALTCNFCAFATNYTRITKRSFYSLRKYYKNHDSLFSKLVDYQKKNGLWDRYNLHNEHSWSDPEVIYHTALFMYEENEFDLSKELLLKSADANHAKSFYMLGILYQEQKGLTQEEIKQSDIKAHEYFNAAFHSGYWPLSCYDAYEFTKKQK